MLWPIQSPSWPTLPFTPVKGPPMLPELKYVTYRPSMLPESSPVAYQTPPAPAIQ